MSETKVKLEERKETIDKNNKEASDNVIINKLQQGKKVKLFFVGKTDFFAEQASFSEIVLKKTKFVFVDSKGVIVEFVLGNMHIAFSELEAYKAYTCMYDEDLRQYKFIPTKGINDKLVDSFLEKTNCIRENNFIIKQLKYERILNILVYIEMLILLATIYVIFFVEWTIGILIVISVLAIYYLLYELMHINYQRYYNKFKG